VVLDLPEPSTDKLDRSPLTLVVCQVRHEETVVASDPRRALQVHEVVRADYPILEEQKGQDLMVVAGPQGVQATPGAPQKGWKMRTDDQAWSVVVMPDFFALETTEYDDWDDFRRRLDALIDAVAAHIDPAFEQRIGLRFIDRIVHPDVKVPTDWSGLIAPSFLGPLTHDSFAGAVTATQQIFNLESGDGRAVVVRHGTVRDADLGGRLAYVIDQDCYVQSGRTFDRRGVAEVAESLHTLALQIFQQAITPPLYTWLRGDEK
jgi:uncharacterized protein (TIGR04255 family)